MTALAIQHRDQIISRVSQGEMLAKVAKDLGIAPPNISKHLSDDPEYLQAREIGAEVRLQQSYSLMAELAEQDLEECSHLDKEEAAARGNLARAREASWRAAAWFAEREFPHRWGQRTHVTMEVTVELGDRLRRSRERVIDVEVAQITHSPDITP